MNFPKSNAQQLAHSHLDIVPLQVDLEEHTLLLVAQAALELQTNLLKSSISHAQTVTGSLVLKATLKHTLQSLIKYTEAEEGSIFLIDEDRVIMESILARGPVTRDIKDLLISQVLDDGLAGWTLRHRQIGLVTDTVLDNRWVQLPNQPYVTRSALAVPLIYGIDPIGIITLTHAQPHHFDEAIAVMLQCSMESITAIIVNARLHAEYNPLGAK
ncbi:GAF domain-containing protein [Pseudanabaena mucicola]|uniref:GAF domain-containing protein n=1 Tax=Pseudanabaena mucicola FACHB-723 TaxID=2692860 RepID=A0ABR7ZXZ9_9CYAN|nr:GAF domain-containing protein [Pseudanabaena mucicola]MBD2188762.1 GAF domain-containing protein [Pseudanabaena mucicola FACHB-723]